MPGIKKFVARDISWLSFNARVLQEAADETVPLRERIRFLGIFSNNLDEFFRVRVATLKRMVSVQKGRYHLLADAQQVLEQIQDTVLEQQHTFTQVWNDILSALRREKIFLKNEKQLSREQQKFVMQYFDEEVESGTNPLMIENIKNFPALRDKSIYLAVVLTKNNASTNRKFALIEVPTRANGRFLLLPSKPGTKDIMLLEDVLRFALPRIFSMFDVNRFESYIIKVTRDAELDIDNDVNTSLIQKIEKGLKARKQGKPVRFIYDREINPSLLSYLIKRMSLSVKDNLIPGGRTHNFRHFIDFPDSVFARKNLRRKPFHHPLLQDAHTVTSVVMNRDVLLHFPYHSFDGVIDLLREAAIDPEVTEIKITAYRLAPQSKVINALINAHRNGKQVTVMLELKARFEEEANLAWKERLEEEGVKVLLGVPGMKVHAKICLIKKVHHHTTTHYGFVSTGNLNERTARMYGDACLLTSDRFIMADVNRIFKYLENPAPKNLRLLRQCKKLLVSPVTMHSGFTKLVDNEIRNVRKGKKAGIILKLNSLSDEVLIQKLHDAAEAGVPVQLIVRGIYAVPLLKKNHPLIKAVSIVDEYLEHARILVFYNGGKELVYISSADWMVRNLGHRIEAACPIDEELLRQEIYDYLQIQLADNTKARILDPHLENKYMPAKGRKKNRAQIDLYNYLYQKTRPAGAS
jgi:polyphosphate kinase